MKTTRTVFAFLLLLTGAVAAQPAFANGPYRGGYRGGYGHGYYGGYGRGYYGYYGYGFPFVAGAVVGGALLAGYPYYYPPYAPYSYYPPYAPYYAPGPTTYVEQGAQPQVQQQPQQAFWYYCAGSNAYYPYVKDCAAGWQRVAPQPGG